MDGGTFRTYCAGAVAVLSVGGAIVLAALQLPIPDVLSVAVAGGLAYLFGETNGYKNGVKNGQKIVQLSRRRKAA